MADPDQQHGRRSLRLPRYDYRSAGAYFVTLCLQQRQPLFGQVVDSVVIHSPVGIMMCNHWLVLPKRFPMIKLDTWVVMPDHLHAIVWLVGDNSPTLGAVLGAFKSLTTNAYSAEVHRSNWLPFDRRLWQRNYHEHVIRGSDDLARIQQYIEQNPKRWQQRQSGAT